MSRVLLPAVVLALSACGDKDSDGTSTLSEDADGDGIAAEYDCDDSDGDVHPGAFELCNDIDDDCDEQVDEDPIEGPTWYLDADGDGSGTAVYAVIACTQPEGFVDNADDCNDGSVVSHPGADELCDDLDNDCDEEIDESPVDAPTWYIDEDGDGYGNPDVPIQACDAPALYVTNGEDCNDGDPELTPNTVWYGDVDGDGYGGDRFTAQGCEAPPDHVDNFDDCDDEDELIHPGAEELCDGVDNNCDGDTDGADAKGAVDFYEDNDGDGWGTDASTSKACNPPEGYAADLGDCDDEVDTTNPDAVEVCDDGEDNDCDDLVDVYCGLVLTDADASWYGEVEDARAGDAVSIGGDYNGDGHVDFAVGAYQHTGAAPAAGRVYLIFGPVSSGTDSPLADAPVIVDGMEEDDLLGSAIDLGGDATGDSYGDLLVGAWGVDYSGSTNAGAAYLYAGPTTGGFSPEDADASFYSSSLYDYMGQYEVLVGQDLTGDGTGDVVVGVSGEDTPYTSGGLLAVFAGPVSGDKNHVEADARVEGTGSSHSIGYSAAIGDIDGDGQADLAWGSTNKNGVWALLGPLSGTLDGNDAEVYIDGDDDASFGADLVLGDFDGDGTQDLAVGDKYDDEGGENAGAFFVFSGPLEGSWDVDEHVAKFTDSSTSHYLGYQTYSAASGDVDEDGDDELIMGSPNHDTTGTTSGSAFLFLGPLSGTSSVLDADMTLYGGDTSDAVGYGLDMGDLDDDGQADVVVGARGWDSDGAGKVYAVFSAGF